jgi:hypothetical protein
LVKFVLSSESSVLSLSKLDVRNIESYFVGEDDLSRSKLGRIILVLTGNHGIRIEIGVSVDALQTTSNRMRQQASRSEC